MGRKEEQEEIGRLGSRQVAFKRDISALVPGVNKFVDAWVEVKGKRTSKVVVGQEFTIKCIYEAENIVGSLLDPWVATVTVKGDGIRNYNDTRHSTKTVTHTTTLDRMGGNIMPAGTSSLVLFLRLHLNDDTAQKYPPETEW